MQDDFAIMLILVIILVILIVILAKLAQTKKCERKIVGGIERIHRPASPHIVVDTLNMVYYLHPGLKKPTPEIIAAAINESSKKLAQKFPGRIMYVIKDRDSIFNDEETDMFYKSLVESNNVYIYSTERYKDPPKSSASDAGHAAKGRDDFFTAILADRYRCKVLTNDRLKDFAQFRASIKPFYVKEYLFWKKTTTMEFINPMAEAYSRLRKPFAVRTDTIL